MQGVVVEMKARVIDDKGHLELIGDPASVGLRLGDEVDVLLPGDVDRETSFFASSEEFLGWLKESGSPEMMERVAVIEAAEQLTDADL